MDVVPGLSTPDRITTLGLPAVRVVAEIAMVVAVGALLLAAFLVPPQRSGYLDVAGYRAVRAAASAALVWALAAALMVPLTVADSVGRSLGDVLDVGSTQTLPRLSTATAWLVTALIALLVPPRPNRARVGVDGRHLRSLPARAAARRADGPFRDRRSARRRQRQPGAARGRRLPVGRRAGRGSRHGRRTRT